MVVIVGVFVAVILWLILLGFIMKGKVWVEIDMTQVAVKGENCFEVKAIATTKNGDLIKNTKLISQEKVACPQNY